MSGVCADYPLNPGAAIGIIGGGQLAKMLSVAATRLGFRTIVYSDTRDCPAGQCCSELIVAKYGDAAAAARFIDACDVITYEFENIPAEFCEQAERLACLRPGVKALRVAQHRLKEKRFAQDLGVSLPSFANITCADNIYAFLQEHTGGCIVKTSLNGYDGKGQARVPGNATREQCRDIYAAFNDAEVLCEEIVPFAAETSVGIARHADGAVSFFPSSENVHHGGILRRATAPGDFADATIAKAREHTAAIADTCDYVGVMAAEFFVLDNGDVLFNEFAPRPHNSLHWTIEGCVTCQFEQHIRAICGWPFGDVSLRGSVRMENIIGDDMEKLSEYRDNPRAKIHLYGKKDALPGRKMGHVTFITP